MSIRRIHPLSFLRPSCPRVAGRLGRAAPLLALAAALACGGADEPAAPEGSGSGAEAAREVGGPSDPASELARKAEEQAELLQGTLPKGFPSDVPRYPGAAADNALSLGGTSLVSFTTDDSAEEVLDFYRSELQSQGWSVRDTGTGGLEGSKENRRVTLRASAAESGAGSDFALSISGG